MNEPGAGTSFVAAAPAQSRTAWTLRPARSDLVRYAKWALFLDVLFIAVYGGCNWLTSLRSDLLELYFDWELAIPFLPAMLWVYLSLYATFPLPVFALRGRELDALGRRLAFATVLGGVLFVFFPARLGFERPALVPGYDGAFAFLYFIDLPHNLVPSLHVTWSALILGSLRAVSPPWVRRAFEAWLLLICAAVVLVHQHHVLDVAAGLLVAYVAAAVVRDDASWITTKRSSI